MSNSITRERQRLLKEMPEELQEVALMMKKEERKMFHGVVKIRRKCGLRLMQVRENPAKYGQHAFKQIAAYLNCKVDWLYKLIRLAETFSYEEVKIIADRVAESAVTFTPSHLIELCEVESDGERDQILESCFTEGYTVRELRGMIASTKKKRKLGVGRKPKRISSVPAGAQQIAKRTTSDLKFMKVLDENVFNRLDDISPAEFTETLATDLKQAGKDLVALQANNERAIERLQTIKEQYESSGNKWPSVPRP